MSLLVTFWRPENPSDYRSGTIRNMSVTGVYIQTAIPFPPPTILEMRLVLDGEPLQVRGEVVRSIGETQFASADGASGMGLRLCEPDAEEVRRLTSFGLNPT